MCVSVCVFIFFYSDLLLKPQTGIPPPPPPYVPRMALGSPELDCMRNACRLARRMLDLGCSLSKAGTTTNEIDSEVRDTTVQFYSIVCTSIAPDCCWLSKLLWDRFIKLLLMLVPILHH